MDSECTGLGLYKAEGIATEDRKSLMIAEDSKSVWEKKKKKKKGASGGRGEAKD